MVRVINRKNNLIQIILSIRLTRIWKKYYCIKNNANKLENTQRRALCLALNVDYKNSNYDDLLKKLELTTLELVRQKCLLIEVFKCINQLSPVYLNNLFSCNNSVYGTRGAEHNLLVPRVNTTGYGLLSFRYMGARLWNGLPLEYKLSDNLNKFRTILKHWEGVKCSCPQCK